MKEIAAILVEDDPYDVKLIQSSIRRSGLDLVWRQTDDEEGFRALLAGGADIVLTDFRLPRFSALRALEIVAELGGAVPVIVVTGAIDDELAAECMKRGAADYLLKDRLARLGDAIQGAIERHRIESARREAERALIEAGKVRSVLNEMLVRSLAGDLSVPAIRGIIAPLFFFEKLMNLQEVEVEADGFGVLTESRADPLKDTVGVKMPLVAGMKTIGSIEFRLSKSAGDRQESTDILSEAAAVLSVVIERALAEKRLKKSLEEKEVLLREIHHRVKNNLAAVASLISLELMQTADEAIKTTLFALEMRISSMSLVHEMLYSRGDFSGIDFDEYARELFVRVVDGLHCSTDRIVHRIDCHGLIMPFESAVTLGILLNELYTRVASKALATGSAEIVLEAREDPAYGPDLWRIEYAELSAANGPERGLNFIRSISSLYEGFVTERPDGFTLSLSIMSSPADTTRSMESERLHEA